VVVKLVDDGGCPNDNFCPPNEGEKENTTAFGIMYRPARHPLQQNRKLKTKRRAMSVVKIGG
jgi:hypothetical protein